MNEQVIQDAAANPYRLLKVANDVLHLGWTKGDADVVTLEYSFPGGRIDIVGTFGRRALLVEVKSGVANESAVEQVWGYVSKKADLKLPETLGRDPEVVGVVLAEGFDVSAHHRATERGVRLVEFRLEPGSFPFHAPAMLAGPEEARNQGPANRTSSFLTVEDHARWVRPTELQNLYRSFATLFVSNEGDGVHPDDAERREWICLSVKKEHVWVRYKGQGIVCLWARKATFLLGYTEVDGKWNYLGDIRRRMSPPALGTIKDAIHSRMLVIDEKMKTELGAFRWTDLRNGR